MWLGILLMGEIMNQIVLKTNQAIIIANNGISIHLENCKRRAPYITVSADEMMSETRTILTSSERYTGDVSANLPFHPSVILS